MARTIAISLSKGGVGKTTTAVNLSAGLALRGRRVLLVDTDTQGQVAGALGVNPSQGLADFVLDGQRQAVTPARNNLYILDGGIGVNRIVLAIREQTFMPHELLATAMAPLDPFFDYVIVDTGPGWSELAINVLAYAKELLCPVPLEMLAVRGLQEFLARTQPIISRTGGALRYIVPTMLDRRVAQSGEILGLLERNFSGLLTDPIRTNVRLSEAPGHGQTIFEYEEAGRGAEDYRRLVDRIIADEPQENT